MFEVRKAKRQRRPLKIALEGLSGSGKTYSALRLAFAMVRAGIGKRIVVADSENESAGLYDGVRLDGQVWEYEVCPIPHDKQHPSGYAECYEYLVGAGYDILIMDSLSHAWHGAQEIIDRYARANRGDKFSGWAQVTPEQRKMLTTLTDPRAHLIATMRVKSEYERTDEGGKSKIKKVGVKTDQRENTEYEFDCVVRLEGKTHEANVEKVRGCTAMDNRTEACPGPGFWKPLFDWWLSAEAMPAPVVWAKADFAALMQRKGKGWANALAWIDKTFGQSYRHDGASFDAVDPKHIAAYAAWVKDKPDVALEAPAAPAAASQPPVSEGDDRPDPTPPAGASATTSTTSSTPEPTPTSTAPIASVPSAASSPATASAATGPEAAGADPAPAWRGGQHDSSHGSPRPRVEVGVPFWRWVQQRDADLAERGLCDPGALTARLLEGGNRKGLPHDLSKWGPAAVDLAVGTATNFEQALSRPELFAVRDQLARTGAQVGACCVFLAQKFKAKWSGELPWHEVPTAQLVALATHLESLPAAARKAVGV